LRRHFRPPVYSPGAKDGGRTATGPACAMLTCQTCDRRPLAAARGAPRYNGPRCIHRGLKMEAPADGPAGRWAE